MCFMVSMCPSEGDVCSGGDHLVKVSDQIPSKQGSHQCRPYHGEEETRRYRVLESQDVGRGLHIP